VEEVKAVATRHGRACRVGTQNRNRKRGLVGGTASYGNAIVRATKRPIYRPHSLEHRTPPRGTNGSTAGLGPIPVNDSGGQWGAPNCWGGCTVASPDSRFVSHLESCVLTSVGRRKVHSGVPGCQETPSDDGRLKSPQPREGLLESSRATVACLQLASFSASWG
jgi:hypothetical protein